MLYSKPLSYLVIVQVKLWIVGDREALLALARRRKRLMTLVRSPRILSEYSQF